MTRLTAATLYQRLGWRPVPVEAGRKECSLAGWPSLAIEQAAMPRFFGGSGNVAVVLGKPSGELVDTDLDCDQALSLADLYLPKTGAIFGRRSRPQSHRLYIASGAAFAAFADPLDGEMLLELRAGGAHQTLLPPSVADGERRQWYGQTIAPTMVEADKLHRRCAYLAIGCLIERHLSAHAARSPCDDLPRLLWEVSEGLGRAAFHWLGQAAPDEMPPGRRAKFQRNVEQIDLKQVVAAIPNNCSWPEWNATGMAIFAVTRGSQEGFDLFNGFSARSAKYVPLAVTERWKNYQRHRPNRIGLGSLIYRAQQAGWRP